MSDNCNYTDDWWEEYELEVYDSKKKKWTKERRYSKCILSPEHSYFMNLIDRKPAVYLGKRLMKKSDWGKTGYELSNNEINFNNIKCDSASNEFAFKVKFV